MYYVEKGFHKKEIWIMQRSINGYETPIARMHFQGHESKENVIIVAERIATCLNHFAKLPESDSDNPWREDPDYPSSDWRAEVKNEDTRRGYWDWVEANDNELKIKDLGDFHFSDFVNSKEDNALGHTIAAVIGNIDDWDQRLFKSEGITPSGQWACVAKALRVHGLKIVSKEKD